MREEKREMLRTSRGNWIRAVFHNEMWYFSIKDIVNDLEGYINNFDQYIKELRAWSQKLDLKWNKMCILVTGNKKRKSWYANIEGTSLIYQLISRRLTEDRYRKIIEKFSQVRRHYHYHFSP